MTGVTIGLTSSQFEELDKFADGDRHRPPEKPNTNLIRRGMLVLASTTDHGFYRITSFGLAALREYERTMRPMVRMSRAIRSLAQEYGPTLNDIPVGTLREFADIVGAFYADILEAIERRDDE